MREDTSTPQCATSQLAPARLRDRWRNETSMYTPIHLHSSRNFPSSLPSSVTHSCINTVHPQPPLHPPARQTHPPLVSRPPPSSGAIHPPTRLPRLKPEVLVHLPCPSPHPAKPTAMPQFTLFPNPSPTPPPQRRFSLQLHNPIPPYYARKQLSKPHGERLASKYARHGHAKSGDYSGTRNAEYRASPSPSPSPPTTSRSRPLPPVPIPTADRHDRHSLDVDRIPRPLPRLPSFAPSDEEERCTCAICKRAEGEYDTYQVSHSHTASQSGTPEMDRLSLVSDDSH